MISPSSVKHPVYLLHSAVCKWLTICKKVSVAVKYAVNFNWGKKRQLLQDDLVCTLLEIFSMKCSAFCLWPEVFPFYKVMGLAKKWYLRRKYVVVSVFFFNKETEFTLNISSSCALQITSGGVSALQVRWMSPGFSDPYFCIILQWLNVYVCPYKISLH